MQVVANREIYNFRRVPGSGFWKGVEIKVSLTLVWVTKIANVSFFTKSVASGFPELSIDAGCSKSRDLQLF